MSDYEIFDHGAPEKAVPITIGTLRFVRGAIDQGDMEAGYSYVAVEEGHHVVELVGDRQLQTSANETVLVNNKQYDYRKIMMSDSGNRVILMDYQDVGAPISIVGRQSIFLDPT